MYAGKGVHTHTTDAPMTKPRFSFLLPLAMFSTMLTGCAHTDQGDTSPLPPMSPETRLENAKKSIEASTTMTPEQKKAALEYAQQGAAAAGRMKQNAPQPTGK